MTDWKDFVKVLIAAVFISAAVAAIIYSDNYERQHPVTKQQCEVSVYDKESEYVHTYSMFGAHPSYHFLYYLDADGNRQCVLVSDKYYKDISVGDIITLEYEVRDGVPISDSYRYTEK